MSTQLGEALIPIRAVLDKLDGDLAKARGKVDGTISKIGSKIQSIGKIAIGGALAGITAIGMGIGAVASQAIPAASDLNEALNATNVVFGDAAGKVQEFGKTAADVAGLSAAEFNSMAAQAGAMLQNYGLSADEAAQATIDLGTRAADMASIFNTDVSEAMTAINAALRGEADPIERFGVSMNMAAVEAQALAMGFEKVDGAFSTTALTQARLALLMEQTDKIAGDFVNTSGELANATRVNEARWQNFLAQVGKVGLPIMTAVQRVLLDVGEKVFPIVTGALERVQPVVEGVAEAFSWFTDAIIAGNDPLGLLPSLVSQIAQAFGMSQMEASNLFLQVQTLVEGIQEFIARVQETLKPITDWISQNVQLQDVLIALSVAILAVVVPAVASVIAAVAPLILTFAGIMAAVVLLRKAWEENWGGIQEKTAAAWETIKPLLQAAWDWLQVNVPQALETLRAFWVDKAWPAIQKAVEIVWPIIQAIFQWYVDWYATNIPKAIETLRSFWVDKAWPAIQRVIEIVWPIIQAIFQALTDFVTGTLIPTIQDLSDKWQTGYETMQTILENVWTVIEAIWTELGRWINDNLVPWVEFLQEKWADTAWPAIQSAIEDAWEVIQPIWQALLGWLEEKLPPALEGLQGVFETVMTAIDTAVGPVKALWEGFVDAVKGFWTWISNKVFDIKINIPDLPDWMIPGSPLPIHIAWKDFAAEMSHTVIRPRFDLSQLTPAMAVVQAGGPVTNTTSYTYNIQAATPLADERDLLAEIRLQEMLHR